jgi:hypothetical protein
LEKIFQYKTFKVLFSDLITVSRQRAKEGFAMTKYFIAGAIIAFAVTHYILKFSLMPTILATAVGGILGQVIATLLGKTKKGNKETSQRD